MVFRFTPFHSVLLLSLYFAQGFPAGLVAHVLPPVMRENGVPLEYIGFIKLLALPWVLKFIWAPWVDKRNLFGWGQHRGWIVTMIVWSMLMLGGMALISPDHLTPLMIAGFLVLILGLNLGASTQDIATDGLAVKLLPPPLRGWGNALQVGGYKIGMIVCSSLLLMSIDLVGWSASMFGMVVVLAFCLLPILLFGESKTFPDHPQTTEPEVGKPLLLPFQTYLAFLRQPGIFWWIAVLLLFKLPDSLASGMIKPMLVDIGLSLSEIGSITLLSSLVGVAAVFAGGGVYDRLGPRNSLAGLALLQAVSLASISLIAAGGLSMAELLALTMFEQLVDSMSTVALFAVMMHYCREAHEGADYSFQACIQVMFAGVASVLSGVIASFVGYEMLYLLAGAISLLIAAVVVLHFRHSPHSQQEWLRVRQLRLQ
ncbi:MFS transporter [Hahella ganghwensis]|uniref:MFS transporter n=1 Tax=Hahella ganghwensis TaxID=286420 RepID=UPI000381D859|nr:MFS transporter [Hahella ganghwensis]